MKKQDIACGVPVVVWWKDSTEENGWTRNPKNLPADVITAGFVVGVSDDGVAVSHTLTIAPPGANLGCVSIPWVCITKLDTPSGIETLVAAR